MDTIQELHRDCEMHLNRIHENFVPGSKVTLIVRTPGNDEADFLLTIDDLNEVAKVIERSKRRASVKSPP